MALKPEMLDSKTMKFEARKLANSLASLPDGCGYFWSPSWLHSFEKVQIRDRTTFHPGATRRDMRGGLKSVELMPVASFVQKMKGLLSRKQVLVASSKAEVHELAKAQAEVYGDGPQTVATRFSEEAKKDVENAQNIEKYCAMVSERDVEIDKLKNELAGIKARQKALEGVLKAVKAQFQPEYESLKRVFLKLDELGASSGSRDRSKWEMWIDKAATVGCKRQLEMLIEKGIMTQQQLATLTGISPTTWRNYRSWFTRNNLVKLDGDWPHGKIELVEI